MLLVNCEIKLILTLRDKFVLSNDAKATTLAVTDKKTLSSSCNFANFIN